ncbi:mannosyltransferase [Winogradskyella maritima]|uniref:Mannosyltransferase n=1 Tax=Winogradskyella maritima TaxID=1517766 RepID=A0ABV8AHE4_9FLAO|nr:mannosyltransferase [Winogradskyella maritima]
MLILLSVILYWYFGFELERSQSTLLIGIYTALFVLAYHLKKSAGFNFSVLVISALVFRAIFLFAIPNLSQDFYRFIWDGRLLFEGFNPYLYTPDSFINAGEFPVNEAQELYNGMGPLSARHYTNYPPLNQLCFYIASLFGGKSIASAVIVLRLIIISADIGVLYFGKKLLEHLKLPSSRIWWYILNPFIIIEFTGNLHFEGVMLFFLVLSFYLLQKGYWKWSAIAIGASVSVKLIPLMFLPVFFWWFLDKDSPQKDTVSSSGVERSKTLLSNPLLRLLESARSDRKWKLKLFELIGFYAIVLATILVLFLPFFSSEFVSNYSQTVGLWFSNFEFNASIYYLAREIGYAITGYNEIWIIGKILPIISLVVILGISFFRKNNSIAELATSITLLFSIYLFMSTTVHPWYVSTVVLVSLFTKYRFPLYWSLAVVLSYVAYTDVEFHENLWVVFLEYVIVFSAFIWEVLLKKRLPFFGQSY